MKSAGIPEHVDQWLMEMYLCALNIGNQIYRHNDHDILIQENYSLGAKTNKKNSIVKQYFKDKFKVENTVQYLPWCTMT